MLTYNLLHPEILYALGTAGHGAQVLIADGNYPVITRSNPNARRVYLNLAPGIVSVTDVLNVLVHAVPIEAAYVMSPAPDATPSIYADFHRILGQDQDLIRLGRYEFYDAASKNDVCLAIATGEKRVYANLLLTIGVVRSPDVPF